MNFFIQGTELLRYAADPLLIAVFCRSLPPKKESSFKGKIICITFLLLIQGLYFFIDGGASYNGRTLLRVFSTLLYIWVFKDCPLPSSLYISLLLSICITGCHNLFMAPYLRDYRIGAYNLLPWDKANVLFCRYSVIGLDFLAVWFFGALVDLSQIRSGYKVRAAIAGGLLAMELLIKHILKLYADQKAYGLDLMVFAVLATGLTVSLAVLYERFLLLREQSARQEHLALAQKYAYENAMNAYHSDEQVRRLHHDLKNHLTAIVSLCEDNARLKEYVRSLGIVLDEYEAQVETGSPMLNGLLNSKLRTAQNKGIRLKLGIDLPDTLPIEDSGLCAILGNLLDNALEAASLIPDSQSRWIWLKIGTISGTLVLRCANPCKCPPDLREGLPRTTKPEAALHGLGLPGVKEVVERAGGYMAIDTKDGQFIISISFPPK